MLHIPQCHSGVKVAILYHYKMMGSNGINERKVFKMPAGIGRMGGCDRETGL
jgi:hypothetical protein